MNYQKKEFYFWIPKYILKTTNCIPKYLESFLNINSEHPKSLKAAFHIANTSNKENLLNQERF